MAFRFDIHVVSIPHVGLQSKIKYDHNAGEAMARLIIRVRQTGEAHDDTYLLRVCIVMKAALCGGVYGASIVQKDHSPFRRAVAPHDRRDIERAEGSLHTLKKN